MTRPITCLLTIHGIGFQQVPTRTDTGWNADGYADPLHQGLKAILQDQLGDDPGRPGTDGAIYVRSRSVSGGLLTVEEGLRRLGHWENGQFVVGDDERLRTGDQPFVHVALVYWPIEDDIPQPGSLLEGIVRSAISLQHYTSLTGLIQTGIADVSALVSGNAGRGVSQSPSLTPRSLVSPQVRPAAAAPDPGSSQQGVIAQVTDTINALQNDWAAYVCRNDLRQRVRGFVRDALARLIANPQVEAVVVNAHSQGTVVAFDVLSDLPGDIRKVKRFLTSGSPLRKYVDLYSWGPDGGSLLDIPWTNFYDPKDPVADPLQPAVWRPGQEVGSAPKSPTLFQSWPDNSATSLDMRIDDRQVDNVTNTTASGLRAHDYWDNRKEVVPTIAEALTASARQIQPVTV